MDELSAALGATAGQNGTAFLVAMRARNPCVRDAALTRLIGALHKHELRRWSVGTKKGGKAKPLSAKVSIDNCHALRATFQWVARRNPLR